MTTITINPNKDSQGREICWDNDWDQDGTFQCLRCAGTGAFITYVHNGVPKGPGGICFRCNGKGHHTLEDRRRNRGFDENRSC